LQAVPALVAEEATGAENEIAIKARTSDISRKRLKESFGILEMLDAFILFVKDRANGPEHY
jgi:hypothetical protein